MVRNLKVMSFISGIVTLVLCAGFLFQWDFVTNIWPWKIYYSQSQRLSEIFVASIFAAIAIPVLWIGIKGEVAASLGGAIDLGVMFAGMGIFCLQLYMANNSRQPVLFLGIFSLIMTVFFAFLGWQVRHLRYDDPRPTPKMVRFSFGFFAVALFFAGTALILKTANIFPWNLPEELRVMYGWVFLGAMCYFVYGVVVPKWGNAAGQLVGFLAYDLILIVPFVQHFQTVIPEQQISLTIYVGVLIYSGVLAVYYLFVHKNTRLIG